MSWLRIGKRSEKIVAVADIGSGSAGFSIAALRSGAPASVLAASRGILPIEERTQEATLKGIAELLKKAGVDAIRSYGERAGKEARPIEEAYIIMRAPWSKSKTARAEAAFEQETRITPRIIGQLAQQALTNEKEMDQSNILEGSVMRVELNGYPTGQPVGKYARSITVLVLVSEGNATARAEIVSAMGTIVPHVVPQLRSSTRALIMVLRARASREEQIFVIDMGSDGTSMFAIRAGAPVEHALVAEGMRTILRRIAPKGLPEETLSLMRMLSRDQCSSAACEALQAAIIAAEPELVRIFGESLAKCASPRRLPNRMLLVAHPDLMTWLSTFFSRIDFAQFTQTTQPFSVTTLSLPDIAAWVVPQSGAIPDAALALDVALVALEAGHSHVG